jgi:preprotein translocase subunit SecD
MRLIPAVFLVVSALLAPAVAQSEAIKLEVKEAKVGEHWVTGKPIVEFVLTDQSAHALWEFSKRNISKPVIFRVDGRDVMKIWIVQELPEGRGALEVGSMNEATALATRLNSGEAVLAVEEDLSIYQKPADKT